MSKKDRVPDLEFMLRPPRRARAQVQAAIGFDPSTACMQCGDLVEAEGIFCNACLERRGKYAPPAPRQCSYCDCEAVQTFRGRFYCEGCALEYAIAEQEAAHVDA